MKKIFLLLFAIPLFGSTLLTYNVYERSDRVDIMLSFDSPYEGSIKQQNEDGLTVLLLSDLNTEESVNKNINSDIVQNLSIVNSDDNQRIELISQNPISITASKTSDKFGLRIRITKLNSALGIQTKPDNQSVNSSSYIKVILVLVLLFIILLVVKRKVSNKAKKTNTPTKEFSIRESNSKIAPKASFEIRDGVDILYEKPLDSSNKVVLLNYENKKYLVLVGSSNVLLDRFGEDQIQDGHDFEVFFEQNRQKLNNYIEERKNALNSYKLNLEKD